MPNLIPSALVAAGTLSSLTLAFVFTRRYRQWARARFIQDYTFPSAVRQKVWQKYNHLNDAQLDKVMSALRVWFQLNQTAGGRFLSMPSQAVDVAWHEFILFTRNYETFCQKSLGRFLHHTPAEAMTRPMQAQDGIKRCWHLSCQRERINKAKPHRLPLLFGIDKELGIADGFFYSTNCSALGNNEYCATHIGSCGSGTSCGSSGWDGNSSDASGDSGSSCGSSCGSGCGGGD